jgi:hypothetical protein
LGSGNPLMTDELLEVLSSECQTNLAPDTLQKRRRNDPELRMIKGIPMEQARVECDPNDVESYFDELARFIDGKLAAGIGCPMSSVAQANLTIKINFSILRSFSSSDILIIYLHAFLQSLHPFETNCIQGLLRDFRQNNGTTNNKFKWSFSAISHQLSFDVAKKEKVRGC